jgi:hypothetical protein
MKIISRLEGLGKGERIYSTRFMGERAYMVTFRQVDPLYVIDLKNPENPKVLGELKIPGYSDYLHPYDANHIIGVGKDAEVETGRAQGLKIAIFDVTDVTNPVVKSEVMLGARGSDSEILRTHKAFLFDKEKELLVIPAQLYGNYFDKYLNEIKTFATILGIGEVSYTINYDTNNNSGTIQFNTFISADNISRLTQLMNNSANLEAIGSNDSSITFKLRTVDTWSYGEEIFNGFKVFKINLTDGIVERGGVEFKDSIDYYDSYYYYNSSRALYIENALYTFKNNILKVNKLDTLEFVTELK